MVIRVTSQGRSEIRPTTGCAGCPVQKRLPAGLSHYFLCAGMVPPVEIPDPFNRPAWCPLRTGPVTIAEEPPSPTEGSR